MDAFAVGEDVWTGGYQAGVATRFLYSDLQLINPQPVVQRYSGGTWKSFKLPDIAFGRVTRLSASGPANVWASGYQTPWNSNDQTPYLAHYDGTWKRMPLPDGLTGAIFGLAATADRVFLSTGANGPLRVFADGQWSTDSRLTNVISLASHPTDGVWTLAYENGARVVAHWTGGAWQTIPQPDGLTVDQIYALKPGYLLAHASDKAYHRWDGTSWTRVTSPASWGAASEAALSPSGVLWTSATYTLRDPEFGFLYQTASHLDRWDGTSWTSVAHLPSYGDDLFYGLTATSTKVWLVGLRGKNPLVVTTAS